MAQLNGLIIGITSAVMFLSILSYFIRLYARRITQLKLWYDDYIMAVGLPSFHVFATSLVSDVLATRPYNEAAIM
ncbi:MAG: hypothetical protein M1816_004288 [Peltula sp. TS41687]|nr:MAG: hypothetical protein M1816_004288 [Peltula sp. TS41687]